MLNRYLWSGALVAVTAVLTSVQAAPAQQQDGWLAFEGCWRPS
jgi:hypothetical protein